MTGLEIMQAIDKRRIASSYNVQNDTNESGAGRRRKSGFQCYCK